MPRVVHFEIHAENPDRAIAFYSSLLGWEFRKWDGPMDYWLIKTGPDTEPGINGGLMHRQGKIDGQSVIAYVCTVGVENLDAYLVRLPSLQGTMAHPKMAIPGVGWLAYVKDTEGNILGLLQSDPAAK